MKSEIRAVAAFLLAAAAAAFGIGIAALGSMWGTVLAGGALTVAALVLVLR